MSKPTDHLILRSSGATARAQLLAEQLAMETHDQGAPVAAPCTLIPEEEGGFSAISANLAGVASRGETEAEESCRELQGCDGGVHSRLVQGAHGETIPWKEVEESTEGRTLWVLVHG